jgi:hypothetical protein
MIAVTELPVTERTVARPFSFPATYMSEPSKEATPLIDELGPLNASLRPMKDISEKSGATRTTTREMLLALEVATDDVRPVAL